MRVGPPEALDVEGAAEASADGRVARSERTRRAIVDALRSLHHEGDLRPTAPRVAERAGVSVRTVWQHFEDLETLLVEAGRRDLEIASGYQVPIDPALPVAERIGRLVEARAQMFEAMAPPWRAARLQAPFSAQLQHNRDVLMQLARQELEQIFATEVAGAQDPATLLDALLVASGWAAWESLRTDAGLDVDASMRVVTLWLTGLADASAGGGATAPPPADRSRG